MVNRTQLVESLHRGICEVVLQNHDGTESILKCTLSANLLQKYDSQLLRESGSSHPASVPVWDVQLGGWRSFNMESVRSFRPSSMTLNG